MAAGVGKRMDICVFYSLKNIKKIIFLLLNGSIMTAYEWKREMFERLWHEYIGNEQPYICNTYVPLKRIQQSGLTLQDLIEMVNEPLPDDCGCLEPKEQREQ